MPIRAIQILRIGNRQRQGSDTFASDKQLGMTDPTALHSVNELSDYLLLSDDLLELHS